MTTRILFVCLGNICRSPTAEAVFRDRAAKSGLDVTVDSAGTSNWHIGDPPYGPAQAAAISREVDMSDLSARQFTAGDFTAFDLIIGMDDQNLERMQSLRPHGNQTPLCLFTDYATGTGATFVPDPYYTRDFEGALDLIEIASDGLIAALQEQ